MPDDSRILVFGYGNPGRRDDGLGPALAAAIESRGLPGVDIEADYQLTVEDAVTVKGHDVVVFADAAVRGAEPFGFWELPAEGEGDSAGGGGCGAAGDGGPLPLDSHRVMPAEVMGLAGRLFGSRAMAYVLAIRGYEFEEFGEGLTERAQANLAVAADFLETVLRRRDFAAAAGGEAAAAMGLPAKGVAR